MRRIIKIVAFLVIHLLTCATKASTPEMKFVAEQSAYHNYIKTYYKAAIQQQKKYKIPASITLAQALLESGAGRSYLALAGNNHFGIKCNDWRGLCVYKDDDGQNDCFRKYLHVAESFEDHSRFLAERPYYRPLFKLKMTDYKAWAKGLKQYGYATDPQYTSKLVKLIENYQLHYYDTAKENDPPAAMKIARSVVGGVTQSSSSSKTQKKPAAAGKKNISKSSKKVSK